MSPVDARDLADMVIAYIDGETAKVDKLGEFRGQPLQIKRGAGRHLLAQDGVGADTACDEDFGCVKTLRCPARLFD